jgi:rubrerythrin
VDHSDERRVRPREYARRRSLLRDDPGIELVDMATLVAIARAIEDEAVRRYALLARLMDELGEPATASAFRVMLEEEQRHVVAVERWAGALGEGAAGVPPFEWHLPSDLSGSWDKVSGSSLLTPYRAFALAVENEERAFAFYAYLAAHAQDARIRAESEKLGAEELRHAALMRRWRRRAYHAERRTGRAGQPLVETPRMLHEVLARHRSAIAATHQALAARLRRAGDETSAGLLELSRPAVALPTDAAATMPLQATATDAGAGGEDDPRHLLIDAQKPLEALADVLEAVMATSEGELFDEAAAAMHEVVERIARIALRAGTVRAA